MKTVVLSATQVAIVLNIVAMAAKSLRADLRGADTITKKLNEDNFIVLESIEKRVAENFNVSENEENVFIAILSVAANQLKSDMRGANPTTKRVLAAQVDALESVINQIRPQVAPQPTPQPVVKEPVTDLETEIKNAANKPKCGRKSTKKVTE